MTPVDWRCSHCDSEVRARRADACRLCAHPGPRAGETLRPPRLPVPLELLTIALTAAGLIAAWMLVWLHR